MSYGLNKAMIIGNLGRDPEVRYTQAGAAVTSIRVATSRKWKDKNSGEMQEETEWHSVTLFGRIAEIVGEYCKKGHKIFVEGRLRTRSYTDKHGVEKWSTEIIAQDVQLLTRAGEPGETPRQKQQSGPMSEDFDDDIPF